MLLDAGGCWPICAARRGPGAQPPRGPLAYLSIPPFGNCATFGFLDVGHDVLGAGGAEEEDDGELSDFPDGTSPNEAVAVWVWSVEDGFHPVGWGFLGVHSVAVGFGVFVIAACAGPGDCDVWVHGVGLLGRFPLGVCVSLMVVPGEGRVLFSTGSLQYGLGDLHRTRNQRLRQGFVG